MGRARAIAALIVLSAAPARAQDATDPAWHWNAATSVFFGVNRQVRKFTNFTAWESQNWVMGAAARELARGRLTLSGMLSLEPLTLQRIGSPQVFQTGETYQRGPLIDYQHPHDLIMQAAIDYERPIGSMTARIGAALVGSPALGPTPFMHRASSTYNPQVPLAHHQLDATHITPGVVTAGVSAGGVTLEASAFHGREPDEQRYDVDLGPLDSWATRMSWTRGALRAQVSGGRLHSPEVVEPFFDVTRLTASIEYATASTSATLAWGENREIHGALDGYLLEGLRRIRDVNVIYLRGELVTKDILDAGGVHPRNFIHSHRLSRVDALSLGYARDVMTKARGTVSIGGDVTGYSVPDNLLDNYGASVSFHVFVRFGASVPAAHVHHH